MARAVKAVVELENGFTRNQSRVSKFITEAKSKMTSMELKTFYLITTLIKMEDNDFLEYSIDINKFCEELGIDPNNRLQVKRLCKTILDQNFTLEFNYEDTSWDLISIKIFRQFSYRAREQKINIMFHSDIKPYLLQLKEKFTKIEQVKYLVNFTSKYAIRIYALLKDYRKMAHRDINLENLSKMLELPDSITKTYTNFRDKVLTPAIKEINSKSDLLITKVEIIAKRGRKITDIRLHYNNKSDEIAFDFVKELIRQYKKRKSFNVFKGCLYFRDGVSGKEKLMTINTIECETHPHYFALKSNDNLNITVLGAHDLEQFVESLAQGIYQAVIYTLQSQKKETIPLHEWQNNKDRIEETKKLLKSWQEKYQCQKAEHGSKINILDKIELQKRKEDNQKILETIKTKFLGKSILFENKIQKMIDVSLTTINNAEVVVVKSELENGKEASFRCLELSALERIEIGVKKAEEKMSREREKEN